MNLRSGPTPAPRRQHLRAVRPESLGSSTLGAHLAMRHSSTRQHPARPGAITLATIAAALIAPSTHAGINLLPPPADEMDGPERIESQSTLAEAVAAFDGRDFDRAETLLAALAARGASGASYLLGVIREHGLTGPPDDASAAEYYLQAASQAGDDRWTCMNFIRLLSRRAA
jgi:hypothetical protein